MPTLRLVRMIFHPWRELRHLAHVRVSHVSMPGVDELAYTNGVDHIWLDKNLLQVERRCALTHELQHIYMGHTGHQKPRVELTVRVITARRLISFDALIRAARWAHGPEELADELAVTVDVLADRIDYLKGEERRALDAADHH